MSCPENELTFDLDEFPSAEKRCRQVGRGFTVTLVVCANPAFYPAGVHTMIYYFGDIQ